MAHAQQRALTIYIAVAAAAASLAASQLLLLLTSNYPIHNMTNGLAYSLTDQFVKN